MNRKKRIPYYSRYTSYRRNRNQQDDGWPKLTLTHRIVFASLILILVIVPVLFQDSWFGNSKAYLDKIFLSHLSFTQVKEMAGKIFIKEEDVTPVINEEEEPYSIDEIPTISLPVIGQLSDSNDNNGVVITAPEGYPVVSVLGGKVVAVRQVAQGMEVEIDHGKGLKTIYSSLKAVGIKPDDDVQKGTVIGYSGVVNGSGGVTFSVKLNDTDIDARNLITGK